MNFIKIISDLFFEIENKRRIICMKPFADIRF